MKKKDAIIYKVHEGSIAEEAGIQQGDILISINGNKIKDIFDYRFLCADEELELEILKPDGEIWSIEIEKDEYEDIGIDFEEPLIEEPKSCRNKCIFCFIDQLPKGMRSSLYFKDDDVRLSFLSGNYVTLTNVDEKEFERIIKYRLSPVNISVHTTNPALRIKMLNNRFAGNIFQRIKKLTDSGITVNCQIVLCRGINDGNELVKTILDLASLYPKVYSISVVPAGLTKHREGLAELLPYDMHSAKEIVELVEKHQQMFIKNTGSRIVYLADEFYILSGIKMPQYEYYEDFPQLENGVGMIALFNKQFNDSLKIYAQQSKNISRDIKRIISVATGVSSYSFITKLVNKANKIFPELKVNVFKIENNFFGKNVTVTGLLTGSDLISQLKGKELGEELLLSSTMFKAGEDLFLDDYTVKMVEQELNVAITKVLNDGGEFLKALLEIKTN